MGGFFVDITSFFKNIINQVSSTFNNLTFTFNDFLDILIVAVIIYWVIKLIRKANIRGGTDNISIACLFPKEAE